jgi:hypothetical protein
MFYVLWLTMLGNKSIIMLIYTNNELCLTMVKYTSSDEKYFLSY